MSPKQANSKPSAMKRPQVELDRLYRTAPVGLCLMDADLRFVRVNERMADINGYPVDYHNGRTLRDIVPRIADRVEGLYRQVLATGEPVLNVKITGASNPSTGVVKYWLWNFYPVTDDDGQAIGVSIVVQEVTELELARQAIEERLRVERLVSEVSAGFLNLPAEQVDDAIERRLGQVAEFLRLERASLIEYHDGEPHLTVTHTWSANGVPRISPLIPLDQIPWGFARALAGKALHFSRLDDLPEEAAKDREFYRQTGPLSVAAIPLARAGARLALMTFVSFTHEQDWSDELLRRLRLIGEIFSSALQRKRAEQALSRSEQRYRTLVENAPEAIVVCAVDAGNFIDVNENAVRLFKLERERLLKATPEQLSPPLQPDGRPSAEGARDALRRALNGETPAFEWVHRDADGRDIPTEVRLVRQSSATRNLVRGSVTDITERKRLEQELHQAQKMEAIGRLAGGIAHDFNNLLTAIQGNAELALQNSGERNPVKTELNEIRAASERAAGLTRQLLAFSRKQNVKSRVLSVNELVGNIGQMLRRVIGEDIRLITALDATAHYVEADPGQLEQVIVNLAVNARDAMPRGGTLTITTRDLALDSPRLDGDRRLVAGPYLELEVADTGTGIATELQSRIFEPFFTTKERGKGTGLGLSLAYGVIAQNNGSIQVDSAPGRGSRFKVCLPCTDARPDRQDGEQKRAVCGSETVLLVEDEEVVRSLVSRGLENYGYSVLEAASGEEALGVSEAYAGPIDMLVTDVIMPGMSGVDLAAHLCQLRQGIDVLFVSGYTDDLLQGHGVSGNDVELLEKPFTPDELAHKVRAVLDR